MNRTLEPLIMNVERVLGRLQHSARGDRATVERVVPVIRTAIDVMKFRRGTDRDDPFRRETFDAVPRRPVGPMWPDYDAAVAALVSAPANALLGELLVALDGLQRQLIFEADCAEATDALANSRQYLHAAGFLDRAATALITLAIG